MISVRLGAVYHDLQHKSPACRIREPESKPQPRQNPAGWDGLSRLCYTMGITPREGASPGEGSAPLSRHACSVRRVCTRAVKRPSLVLFQEHKAPSRCPPHECTAREKSLVEAHTYLARGTSRPGTTRQGALSAAI